MEKEKRKNNNSSPLKLSSSNSDVSTPCGVVSFLLTSMLSLRAVNAERVNILCSNSESLINWGGANAKLADTLAVVSYVAVLCVVAQRTRSVRPQRSPTLLVGDYICGGNK